MTAHSHSGITRLTACRMSSIRRTFLVGALLVGIGAFGPGAAQTERGDRSGAYTVEDLGDTSFRSVNSINDDGQVVGSAVVDGSQHAVLFWHRTVIDLGTVPGGSDSAAYAINNYGQVAGQARDSNGFAHAALFDDGTVTDLGTLPGGSYSEAHGINDDSEVVGNSDIGSGLQQPALFENGRVTRLGLLPGDEFGQAFAINNRGQAVGYSASQPTSPRNTGITHAVLFEHGSVTDLGVLPGGTFSNAFSINDRGEVVGAATDSTGIQRAALFVDGEVIDLGFSKTDFSTATDINERGDVVGYIGSAQAVLFAHGRIINLPPLPRGRYSMALAINDHGQVLGLSDDRTGALRPVLWTPRRSKRAPFNNVETEESEGQGWAPPR